MTWICCLKTFLYYVLNISRLGMFSFSFFMKSHIITCNHNANAFYLFLIRKQFIHVLAVSTCSSLKSKFLKVYIISLGFPSYPYSYSFSLGVLRKCSLSSWNVLTFLSFSLVFNVEQKNRRVLTFIDLLIPPLFSRHEFFSL